MIMKNDMYQFHIQIKKCLTISPKNKMFVYLF